MFAPSPPADICSQAERLDRKLEQLLAYLAEQLADQNDTDKATTATAPAVIDNTTED